MEIEKAKRILIDAEIEIGEKQISGITTQFVSYIYGKNTARLDGSFTADELEALAVCMRKGQ